MVNLSVSRNRLHIVMPGLVPGIHVVLSMLDDVDGRDKPGHDDAEGDGRKTSIAICDSPARKGEGNSLSAPYERCPQLTGIPYPSFHPASCAKRWKNSGS